MYMSFKTTLEGIDVIIIFDSTSVVGFIVVLHITLCMTEIIMQILPIIFSCTEIFGSIRNRSQSGGGGVEGQRAGVIIYI